MSQYKNDVTCKHANSGTVQIFHVDRVKPFYGSLEEATTLAQVDYQQFVIADITAYRGDPHLRSKMEFLITYEDGTISWKSWDQDLFRSLPYEHFCRSIPQLRPLILKVAEATSQAKTIDRQSIETVRPGLIGYMDLRWYSFDWYAGLGLPNEDTTIYVLQYQYGAWVNNQHRRIHVKFAITGDCHTFGHYAVLTWGSYLGLAPTMVLCDDAFIQQYPQILGNQ